MTGQKKLGPVFHGAERAGLILFAQARQRAQAARADVNAAHLSIHQHPLAMDVGAEHAIRGTHRVTDVVPERRPFSANLTFCHNVTSRRFQWRQSYHKGRKTQTGGA